MFTNMKLQKKIWIWKYVNKYLSLDDVINNFPNKYGISFKEIHPLKGQRIFNVDLYIDD